MRFQSNLHSELGSNWNHFRIPFPEGTVGCRVTVLVHPGMFLHRRSDSSTVLLDSLSAVMGLVMGLGFVMGFVMGLDFVMGFVTALS